MRIAITGASGMIGTALRKECKRLLWPVDYEFGDLRGGFGLASPVDLVVHLAANARVHESVKYPYLAWDNLDMCRHVFDWCRLKHVPVVFTSSREVYGEQTLVNETALLEALSPYAAAKIAAEKILEAYHHSFGLNYTILRLSNVYGKYDHTTRVIPRWIEQIKSRQFPLFVYGSKSFDFTYIDDCVNGIVLACQYLYTFDRGNADYVGRVFNIASGQTHVLEYVAKELCNVAGVDPNVTLGETLTGEVEHSKLDIRRAQEELCYIPKVQIDEGLRLTWRWYADAQADEHSEETASPVGLS